MSAKPSQAGWFLDPTAIPSSKSCARARHLSCAANGSAVLGELDSYRRVGHPCSLPIPPVRGQRVRLSREWVDQ